jgi:hypothetical protein
MKRWVWRLTVLWVFVSAGPACAEPVTKVRDHGDSSNRINLVFLGDGYTASQLEQFAGDVERVTQGFFAQQPFTEYQRYFNVYRIDVASPQSGADHPEANTSVNTAFDAGYQCNGIDRLICVNVSKVEAKLSANLPIDAQRLFAIVLVNDRVYGGSGGRIAVASLDTSVIELLLHEFGHSFGLLADEYTLQPPPCDETIEPEEPNVTKAKDRNTIKWNHGGGPPGGWIETNTDLPSKDTAVNGPIGIFAGARYCASGLYRPTYTSKMRDLGQPYRAVNEEQLVKRVYNYVAPIDFAMPGSNLVAVPFAGTHAFEVHIPVPFTHALTIKWFVNQQEQQRGSTTFNFDASGLLPGQHNIQAVVTDTTDKVRFDPNSVLTDTHTWNVEIGTAPATPFASLQGRVQLLRKTRPLGTFAATGKLVLGSGSNGIRPQREPVTISISSGNELVFSQSLAARKLRPVAPRVYEYKTATVRSGINLFQLTRTDKPLTYRFRVEGQRLDLRNATTDAITLAMEIGDDADQTVVNCRVSRGRWLRCP